MALSISFIVNSLALYGVVSVIKRCKIIEYSARIERLARKAYISRKKFSIASTQIRKIRGEVFKLSMFQFFIPLLFYIVALVIYAILSILISKQYIDVIDLNNVCLVPPPRNTSSFVWL